MSSPNSARNVRILIINTKDSTRNPNSYMTLEVAEGFRKHLGRDSVWVVTSNNLVREAQRQRPDAIVCFDGEELPLDVVLQVKKMGVSIVGWLTEDPYELPTNLRNQDIYDVVFTNERNAVSEYAPGKAAYLPLAASQEFCYYPVRETCKYDVCIAGTAWPERVALCKELRRKLPDVKWKFILHGLEEIPKYKFPEPHIQTDYRLSIQDVCRVFNQSKITISLKREYSGHERRVGLSPAPRIFETALSGTAQLVETGVGDEVGDFFELGEEVCIFRSVDECADLVRRLLAEDTERRKIATAGQQRALRDHSYSNRVGAIVDWVNSHRSDRIVTQPTRRILVCVHSTTTSKVWGGTEILTEELVEGLKASFSVQLLVHSTEGEGSLWRIVNVNTGEIEEEQGDSVDPTSVFTSNDFARFKRILLGNHIGLVHFQHLLQFPLALPTAALELGIPYTIAWTDYYPICHKFTLVNNFGVYCHPDKIPIDTCDVCLNATHGYPPGSQTARREVVSSVMLDAAKIIAVSEYQAHLIGKLFPEISDRIDIAEPIPESAEKSNSTAERVVPAKSKDASLRVAIPGNFTKQKGADVAVLVMRYFRDSPDVSFTILSRVDPEYEKIVEETGLKSASNVHFWGGYPRSHSRISVYEGIDLALFLSIWPEGYPMTLYELKQAGVPCIVTDVGQRTKEVQDGFNGWKVPPQDPGAVISIINRLIEDRTILESVRANLITDRKPVESYSERLRVMFDGILATASASEENPSLTLRQVEWLGGKIRLPAVQTSWSLAPGASSIREQGALLETSPGGLGLPTPRQLIRRFRYYMKQRGLVATVRMVAEWLIK